MFYRFSRLSFLMMSLCASSAFSATLTEFNSPVDLHAAVPDAVFEKESATKKRGLRAVESEESASVFVSTSDEKKKIAQANFVLAKPIAEHHERFVQMYKGLRVRHGELIQHQGVGPAVTVTGVMVNDLEKDLPSVEPRISKEEALVLARAHQEREGHAVQNGRDHMSLEIDIDPNTQKARLVYQVIERGVSAQGWKDTRTLVDATTGEVVHAWDNTAHAEMEGKGGSSWSAYYGNKALTRSNAYSFKKNPQKAYELGALEVQQSDDICTFKTKQDRDEADGVSTYTINDVDMEEFFEHHALPYTYSQFKSLGIVSVNCLQGVKDERSLKRPQGNVKLYSQINDAHYYADATQKMFATWYNVRPFRGRVHVVTHADFCNAFALPPALDSKGKPLYPDEPEQFWVGTGYMTEDKEVCAAGLATADVVAHELGHLVTGHYSNLIYDGQSGGINEAFSDMTGMALQDFLYEQYHWATYGYWIGGQVFMFSPYYLRSMAYPEADGSSISQFSAYSDESDVHYTSGIFNKAFYNLAEEHQWGVKKAYQLMLTANMNYWTEHETFGSALCGIYSAADELGYNSVKEKKDIKESFSKQGVVCQH